MSLRLRNISLMCIALTMAVFSASPSSKGLFPSFFSHAAKSHGAGSLHHGLAKTAAALVYAQTGANHFSNAGTDNAPVWMLSSRDTIIYDAAGHKILSMSSNIDSGWGPGDISSLDSAIYSNGKLVETISKSFNSYSGTSVSYGYRSTITYLNNDKVIITTDYDWNDLTQTWRQSYKDSIVFSSAANITDSGVSNLTNLTASFSWNFDTTNNTWTSNGYYSKVDAECTATSLVVAGKEQSSATDLLVDAKMIISFTSPVWIEKNMLQQVMQQKDPGTGNYVNVSKSTRQVNASGYTLGYEDFDWDDVASAWVPSYISLDFPDAHGNDTFDLSASYNTATSTWDTSSMDRYSRTYDANGNNTVILTTSHSSFDGTWSLSDKTVNTFAQINMAVKGMARQAAMPNIIVEASPTVVTFSGRNIEGVDLYNAAGRSVLSIRQKAAAGLSLNLTGNGVSIPAGVYIAQLRTASGKYSISLPVCR